MTFMGTRTVQEEEGDGAEEQGTGNEAPDTEEVSQEIDDNASEVSKGDLDELEKMFEDGNYEFKKSNENKLKLNPKVTFGGANSTGSGHTFDDNVWTSSESEGEEGSEEDEGDDVELVDCWLCGAESETQADGGIIKSDVHLCDGEKKNTCVNCLDNIPYCEDCGTITICGHKFRCCCGAEREVTGLYLLGYGASGNFRSKRNEAMSKHIVMEGIGRIGERDTAVTCIRCGVKHLTSCSCRINETSKGEGYNVHCSGCCPFKIEDATLEDIVENSVDARSARKIPSTQKAVGITRLARLLKHQNASGEEEGERPILDATLFPTFQKNTPEYPFFARPCPTVPRHGFVDSRVIHNDEEWFEICRETYQADEGAEILCCPYIDAEWNIIMTPNGITIGPGNDGATSGKDAIRVPLDFRKQSILEYYKLVENFHKVTIRGGWGRAGVTSCPYIEMVVDKDGEVWPVQIRDGPAVETESGGNFIPHEVEVQEVVDISSTYGRPDLGDWERKVKDFDPGTVVYHPSGTIASHYAVHCIVNDVPVILENCSRPKEGDILEPEGGVPELTEDDYEEIAQWMRTYFDIDVFGDLNDHTLRRQTCALGIVAMHHQASWGTEEHLLQLRAFGAVVTYRMAAAACIGEARHFNKVNSRANRNAKMKHEVHGYGDWDESKKYKIDPRCYSELLEEKIDYIPGSKDRPKRKQVYAMQATEFSHGEVADSLVRSWRRFRVDGWGNSYGGDKWRWCARESIRLGKAIAKFMRTPNKDRWNDIVEAWNKTIHVAHNHNKMLTKFTGSTVMDAAQTRAANYVGVEPIMDFVVKKDKNANADDLDDRREFADMLNEQLKLYKINGEKKEPTVDNGETERTIILEKDFEEASEAFENLGKVLESVDKYHENFKSG